MTAHREWCGERCQGELLGEHRAEPMVWATPYGRLIGTVVDAPRGMFLEVWASVRLGDDMPEELEVLLLLSGVHASIMATTGSGEQVLPLPRHPALTAHPSG